MSFGTGTSAPPAPARKRRVALVIGNGAYRNTDRLANPINDARDISAVLTGIGFEVVGGSNDGVDLDYGGMAARLRDFARRLRDAEGGEVEAALLYYAGHGLQVDGRNYLMPVDAALEYASDVSSELFELQHFLNDMQRPGRTSIAFIDACRNNPLARTLAIAMGPSSTRSADVVPGLAEQKANTAGTLIAFATQPGLTAYDGAGKSNSVFTEALLAHLPTPDREIELMLKDVRATVFAATQNRERGPQVTWESSSLIGGAFYLNPTRQRLDVAPERPDIPKAPATSTAHLLLAGQEWAHLQTSVDIDRLGSFARNFSGYYSELALSRVAQLERQAADRARKAAELAEIEARKKADEEARRRARDPIAVAKQAAASLGGVFNLRWRDLLAPPSERVPTTAEELEQAAAKLRAKEQQWRDEGRFEVRVGSGSGNRSIWLKPGESAPRDLDIGPEMVLVPPGVFWMGSEAGEGYSNEHPRHEVTIGYPLLVGKYPIMFGEWNLAQSHRDWKRHTGTRPGSIKPCGAGGVRRPVEGVTWVEARAYVTWLSKYTGKTYRLLSEAEWEYCCRAGAPTPSARAADARGRLSWQQSGGTALVGSAPANDYGLYDMLTLSGEWCEDNWHPDYTDAPGDGIAWSAGLETDWRVVRGGEPMLRASRFHGSVGFFRVAREVLPAA